MEILAIRNLSFTYPGCSTPLLKNISFSVEEGEFLVVCGPTGCGKSTLLRILKKELIPNGTLSGEVTLRGKPVAELDARTAASKVGFVMQRPEQQLVADKVWHELAFGLENLGVPTETIRRRVAEMAAYFDIETWFDRRCDELSGGQKQLLNLASVMVMQPEVLILDEPTAQLDPIAAADFLNTVRQLNRETGLTVILVEHRLEELVAAADRLLLLESGMVADFDTPAAVCERLRHGNTMLEAMPAAVRLCKQVPAGEKCPLNVREGRQWLRKNFVPGGSAPFRPEPPKTESALTVDNIWFRYARSLPDVLNGTSLEVHTGEIFSILGGNGSGKSTLMSCISGIRKPYSGSISVFGKKLKAYENQTLYQHCLTFLPQDVQTLFLYMTVREELKGAEMVLEHFPVDLSGLLDRHPYDLSGGEQQLVALVKVLASEPKLLLLDEPTKGLDAYAKKRIGTVLKGLQAQGVTIVMVTHDVDFAAELSDRCALFFRGEALSVDTPERFFSENRFYTTAVNRMTAGIFSGAVTLADAVKLCEESRAAT